MYPANRSSGFNPLTISLIAMTLVFGGFFLWQGFVEWVDRENADRYARATQTAIIEITSTAAPTDIFYPSPTPVPDPVPECQIFFINAEAAYIRECPSRSCEEKDRFEYETEVCVYGKTPDTDLANEEWYIVDLNAGGVFADIGYMHESVLKPRFPTPRPSQTFTPRPTITLTPSPTPSVMYTPTA